MVLENIYNNSYTVSDYTSKAFPIAPKNTRIALVCGEFNEEYITPLKKNCYAGLQKCEVEKKNIMEYTVPGALEIPGIVKKLQYSKKFDAIIALGIVIRGGTNHYEIVTEESARGIMHCTLHSNIPVINGILGGDTPQSIQDRLSKGEGFGSSAVKMISLHKKI